MPPLEYISSIHTENTYAHLISFYFYYFTSSHLAYFLLDGNYQALLSSWRKRKVRDIPEHLWNDFDKTKRYWSIQSKRGRHMESFLGNSKIYQFDFHRCLSSSLTSNDTGSVLLFDSFNVSCIPLNV